MRHFVATGENIRILSSIFLDPNFSSQQNRTERLRVTGQFGSILVINSTNIFCDGDDTDGGEYR